MMCTRRPSLMHGSYAFRGREGTRRSGAAALPLMAGGPSLMVHPAVALRHAHIPAAPRCALLSVTAGEASLAHRQSSHSATAPPAWWLWAMTPLIVYHRIVIGSAPTKEADEVIRDRHCVPKSTLRLPLNKLLRSSPAAPTLAMTIQGECHEQETTYAASAATRNIRVHPLHLCHPRARLSDAQRRDGGRPAILSFTPQMTIPGGCHEQTRTAPASHGFRTFPRLHVRCPSQNR
jgi:hypothetical protein